MDQEIIVSEREQQKKRERERTRLKESNSYMGANVYMRVCFFVLGTCYKVLSYYSSHLAQTVILFF